MKLKLRRGRLGVMNLKRQKIRKDLCFDGKRKEKNVVEIEEEKRGGESWKKTLQWAHYADNGLINQKRQLESVV